MELRISSTKAEMARQAAEKAGEILKAALDTKDTVRFIAATGMSQLEMLDHLCTISGIDWARTEMFHLDEYIGLPDNHPASFRRYLQERIVNRVHPGIVHLINGDAAEPTDEIRRLGTRITKLEVDLALVGIGENGHLAFNDPPADFDTEDPYLVIALDDACRRQQVGEGWFASIDEVPPSAISMSIRQIMKATAIVCTVPGVRKAEAVRDCLSDSLEVSNTRPASILRTHPNAFVYLDTESASLMSNR